MAAVPRWTAWSRGARWHLGWSSKLQRLWLQRYHQQPHGKDDEDVCGRCGRVYVYARRGRQHTRRGYHHTAAWIPLLLSL